MQITNQKFAITGASRGLGAALAIEMARAGTELVLLARTTEALQETASKILELTGQKASLLGCDLANPDSAASAGTRLAKEHTDLDGLIHNGAMWLPGPMDNVSDSDIQACIASAAIGSLILTRHVLPNFKARDHADIHTVVSTSGLPNRPLQGASAVFTAAKSAQAGFVHGLSEEFKNTNIRITSVFPGEIEDVSPTDPEWTTPLPHQTLSNREVVSAILFTLNQPPQVAVQSLVIQ
ncbi:MAG: SDR family NAD(P)-dependent oxidoreductase [Pseudomonadota bacterium]